MLKANFDNYANEYDEHFTLSNVGKVQRFFVHRYCKTVLKENIDLYEINCGTGYDAMTFANTVNSYIATDASEEMIKVCNAKKNKTSIENLYFYQSSIQNPREEFYNSNLIYSNFGGLNCLSLDEFNDFVVKCDKLKENTELIFVIMGNNCLWEKFYFKIKKAPLIANRRKKINGVETEINGIKFITNYYSPSQIINFLDKNFVVCNIKPIGLFVPPSYMEGYFKKHKFLLAALKFMDLLFSNFSFLSNNADHYLIHLKKIK